MKKLMLGLVVLTCLLCKTGKAENSYPYGLGTSDMDIVHFAAHFGMGYTVNTFTYGFMHKVLGAEQVDSMMFSFVTTLLVGATVKMAISSTQVSGMGQGLLIDGLGAITSSLTMVMFKF